MSESAHYNCPWCQWGITVTNPMLFSHRRQALERDLRRHVLSQHRVRWRLSRRWRKALKA